MLIKLCYYFQIGLLCQCSADSIYRVYEGVSTLAKNVVVVEL